MLYQILIAPIEMVMDAVLSLIYSMTGSYGIGILLLSLLINVVLLPLFQVAEKWQAAERKIQDVLKPKLKEFKHAFSGEERHTMIKTLYRQAGYHPIYALRSSVGLLLQLPFWIAGYQLLSGYAPLQGASFLMLSDLGKPDGLLGGINLLPFLMTGLNLLGAFVYTKGFGIAEKLQPVLLAVIFLVLLYPSPAGLLLYWTFNSLLSYLRIALLNPAEKPSSVPNRAAGSDKLRMAYDMLSGIVRLRLVRDLSLFVLAAVGQLAVYKQLVDISPGSAMVVLIISGGVIVYVCLAEGFDPMRGSEKDLRERMNIWLIRFFVMLFIGINAAYVLNLYRFVHPGRSIGGILLGLLVFRFVSPLCEMVPTLRRMANDHHLFVLSAGLASWALFLGNPMAVYFSLEDFAAGGASGVPARLFGYFMAVYLGIGMLYLLMSRATRNGMTLVLVFLSTGVMFYSVVGVPGVGIMDHFILEFPAALNRNTVEIITEMLALLAAFALTAYLTVNFRQTVMGVLGATLATSIYIVASDFYGAKDTSVAIADEFHADHGDLVDFSPVQNVLVIMLDGFPGGYVQTLQANTPAAFKEYDGFVWYPNMLTTNAGTWGSIATLVGGHQYTVQAINSRNEDSLGSAINKAYRVYSDAFIPNGYHIAYVNPSGTGGCHGIDERVRCATTIPYGRYYHDKERPDVPFIEDQDGHLPFMLTMLSVFKASPFFLKRAIYNDGNYRDANSSMVRAMTANAYKSKEWGFLRVLTRERKLDNRSKTFKFIQVSIPHFPLALNEDCKLDPQRATVYTESACAIQEIGVLLAWLKEKNIYDATRIVVVSDHGSSVENSMFPDDFVKTVSEGYQQRGSAGFVQSLLLVKDFKARGDMRRSDVFVSNPDVPSVVCAGVAVCRDVMPDPTSHDLGDRTLMFNITALPFDEAKVNKFTVLESYEVRKNIFDPRNWKKVQ